MTTTSKQKNQLYFTVTETYHDKRMDFALAQLCPEYSRSTLKTWIQNGAVSLNNQITTNPRQPVKTEDIITVIETPRSQAPEEPEHMDLDILFEDEDLLVVNKPPGLVVHPGAGNPKHTLMHGMLAHHPNAAHLPRAGIIHRLDKNTSGALMVAKNEQSLHSLTLALKNKAVKRHYLAVVSKSLYRRQTISAPVGRHPSKRTLMAVTEKGKEAITHFTVKETFARHTLLSVQLETGRTHQIRVHFAHKGFPILGDPVYNRRLIIPKNPSPALLDCLAHFKRQALHAECLAFVHPRTKETITCNAPIPKDMQQLIDLLKEHHQHNQ
jgi:23S rRNA pseudouridine1911/1915/1917 synthase